ncbi:hypothetical protein BCR35DRAFT_310666 [Leucosporidium creatinivorum]|uniref:DNA mismatch repair protein MutS-like N-terminal domain-containing protein n=1 Tax=Leucosporidium creatinivorum TaxID=106004 RepID=A0A1Y2CYS4_9BASI|nr:hypothetical protein BCR35DRAFT_310666 [Leucosporidium creatinivorum]
MSSLKQLMKAKKAEARLNHPQAHYNDRGQLSCLLCSVPIKQASLFAPHLVSKGHRVNVQKQAAAEASSSSNGKRKREGDDEAGSKRAREEGDDEDDEPSAAGDERALPADFFADPSQAPAPAAVEEEEPAVSEQAEEVEDDPEWAAFEASLAAGPTAPPPTKSTASATIFAAPVQYEFGAPKVAEEGEGEGEQEEEEEQEETEEEKAARIDQEEREEIMSRIEEEEREQMEADEKVAALKRRLEAVRAARQKKKAT